MTNLSTLRAATAGDVQDVKALADTYLLQRVPKEERSTMGFLVSGFSLAEYHAFVRRADHFLLAVEGQTLIGFILAYSSELVSSEETVNMQILKHAGQPLTLIKQVCVQKDRSGQGIARDLYQAVRERSPSRPCYAAVVAEPANTRSVRFHERIGAKQELELTAPDGMPRTIWALEPLGMSA